MKWGIPDVETWLAKLPHGTLNKWIAFDAVEPIGEEWRQTAETNQLLTRLIEFQAVSMGLQFEATTSDDCMPSRYQREAKPKVKTKQVDARNQFQEVAAALGLGKVVKKHGRINQSS